MFSSRVLILWILWCFRPRRVRVEPVPERRRVHERAQPVHLLLRGHLHWRHLWQTWVLTTLHSHWSLRQTEYSPRSILIGPAVQDDYNSVPSKTQQHRWTFMTSSFASQEISSSLIFRVKECYDMKMLHYKGTPPSVSCVNFVKGLTPQGFHPILAKESFFGPVCRHQWVQWPVPINFCLLSLQARKTFCFILFWSLFLPRECSVYI